ncbi:hypothetical protein [Halobaculum sp. EA56]|uniref:hypothetical protein n=1 Tax=Halobaculum sp. EA56 TaxID=3421648 RepID=UPI003EBA0C2B
MNKTETALCTKCKSEIDTTVERCPKCGYEPSVSIIGKLFFWLCALPGSILFGFLAIISVFGLISGSLTLGEFVGGLVGIGIIGGIPFWYTRRYLRIRNQKPTEEN